MQRRSCGVLLTCLVALLAQDAVAVPTWSSGRRALGPAPAASSPKESATSSMFPYMTLKPYLPTKPANPFTPAFVPDPQMFVDKKAELLNNLFSSPAMMGGASVASDPAASSGKAWSVGPGGPWAPAAPSKRALVGPWGAPTAGGASSGAPVPWATPAAAPVDPSVFMDKKAGFLSKLFSDLGTAATKPATPGAAPAPIVPPGFWMPFPPTPPTTPAPADPTEAKAQLLAQLLQAISTETSTETPPVLLAPPPPTTGPKVIVPPSYWIPTDPLAGPGTYMQKVSDYLDKLFASLNTTAAPEAPSARSLAARHHEWQPQDWERAVTATSPDSTTASPLAAKDLVVNSILSEVANLKTAMLDTLNEMITKQKEAAAAAATTKKPMKFGPFPWGPTPKPTPDPTEPYQKRIETFGQVFDMLTALGQEVATGGSPASAAPPANATAPSSRPARSLPLGPPARSVQMAVHQGYQSMPPGTEEIVSAGAGRDPATAHEGGGLNLKIKIPQ